MLTLALLAAPAFATDPIRIQVADPTVREVTLECAGGRKLSAKVVGGNVSFAEDPGQCTVLFTRAIGTLPGPASYVCTDKGCTRAATEHRQVEAAEGRVTVVLTDASAPTLELTCNSGYRSRAQVETNTAVFDGVPPNEDCVLYWKGGNALARASKITPGLWYCQATSGTGICARK